MFSQLYCVMVLNTDGCQQLPSVSAVEILSTDIDGRRNR